MTERMSERWRPRTITEIVGQPDAVAILSAWMANPVPKAWCLLGDAGCGKTTAALCIAESLYDGKYPTPEFVNGSSLKIDELPALHKAQLICSPFTCGNREGHHHVMVLDEFERMSPQAQQWVKCEWELLPPAAVIVATSNSVDAISDACIQRFDVIEFDSGPAFEQAALERCVQIWTAEITKRFGVEAPTFDELRRLGDSRDKFSLRQCINKIEQKLSILTHNSKSTRERCKEADAHAERIGL